MCHGALAPAGMSSTLTTVSCTLSWPCRSCRRICVSLGPAVCAATRRDAAGTTMAAPARRKSCRRTSFIDTSPLVSGSAGRGTLLLGRLDVTERIQQAQVIDDLEGTAD